MPGTLGNATSAASGLATSAGPITGQKLPSQLRASNSSTGFTTNRPLGTLHRFAGTGMP